jgi:hypothetical protein
MTTAEQTAQTSSHPSNAPPVALPVGITAGGVVIEKCVGTDVAAYVDELTAAVTDIECRSHDLCVETGHTLIPREVVLDRIRQVAAIKPSITSVAEYDLHAHIADLLKDTEPCPLAARIRAVLDGCSSDVANASTQGAITA